MPKRRERGLQRGVGLGGVAAILFGNTAAAVFLVLGITAREALGLTPLVFVIAGGIFFLVLLPYLEGIAALPQAGGSSGFARRGFDEVVSFLTAWALTLDYIIVIAMSAFFTSHYLAAIPGLEALADSPWDASTAVLLIASVGLANIRAIRVNALIAVVVSEIALVAQVLLALIGLALVFDAEVLTHAVRIGSVGGLDGIAFALPIAMVAFTGLDAVANLSGEFQVPARRMAPALIWSGLVSVTLLVLMSVLALSAMPVHGTGARATTQLAQVGANGYIDRPLAGVVEHLPLGGSVDDVAGVVLAVLAASVLFLIANTSLNGLSRLVYNMSVHRQVPSALARIDRRTGVPSTAVGLYTLVSIGLLVLTETLRSSAIVLAQLYAFGSMFSLMAAMASIVRLRVREPDLERPIRAGLDIRIRGRDISLVAVAGFLAALAVWCMVLATHDAARVLGLIWMVAGFVMYGTYRLTHGHGLRAAAEPRTTAEVQISARAYERILLAIRPEKGRLWGSGDAELAALAYKLLDDAAHGSVAAMLVHELPLTVALSADLGVDEAITTRRLSLLRAVTDKLGVRLTSTVMRARAAGRAICQEAQRRDVDAVVMATRMKRRSSDVVFGKTVSYVLRHAPCDVVILSFPAESLTAVDRAGGQAAERRARETDASSKVRPS